MSSTAGEEAAFFEARGFGMRIGFGQRPALPVIDIVKAFTGPGRMLGASLDAKIGATNALIDVAHAKGVPVICSSVACDNADCRDASVWRLKRKGVATLVAGSDGPELDPRLRFRKGDTVLLKKYASCLFGTDLVSRLLAMAVDTPIITGCTTGGCVGRRRSIAAGRGSGRWWCARASARAWRRVGGFVLPPCRVARRQSAPPPGDGGDDGERARPER